MLIRELAACGVAFVGACAPWAGAALIHFDDLPSGTVVTDQYQSQGVVFSGFFQAVGPGPFTNAVSDPNSVAFYNPTDPTQVSTVTAWFFVPGTGDAGTTDFVSFTPTDASDFSTIFEMRAYNLGNQLIGTASRGVASTGVYSPGEDPPVSISVPGIARVEMSGSVRPGANFVIEGDNFEFSVPGQGSAWLLGLAGISAVRRKR